MKIRVFTSCAALALTLFLALPVEAQAHRGQMDTDGILSPGEIPNPRINYGYGWGSNIRRDRFEQDRYPRDDRRWPERNRWDYRDQRGGSFSSLISDGARSGRLSRAEEAELKDMQDDIRRREYEYRRDGGLSNREIDDLAGREDSLRKKLDHELNDGERRR